jgi:hypothetical protein
MRAGRLAADDVLGARVRPSEAGVATRRPQYRATRATNKPNLGGYGVTILTWVGAAGTPLPAVIAIAPVW